MRRSWAVWLVFAVLGVGTRANAQGKPVAPPAAAPSLATAPKVAPLADFEKVRGELKNKDFRLRTQAALALGASGDQRAVDVLCASLADANAAVRAAAAAGLERLDRGGGPCLEKRIKVEGNPAAKAAVQQALTALGGVPKITPSTLYYLSVGSLADRSGRAEGELDRVVQTAIRKTGNALGTIAFAPSWETPPQAKQRLAKNKLRAFYLKPTLPPFRYNAVGLNAKLDVALASYPDKVLRGSIGIPLISPGVKTPNRISEDELIAMAASRAVEKLVKVIPTLQD